MKTGLLLLLFFVQLSVFAQSDCHNPHHIFFVPKDKTPKVVTKLGTDPQFPIMCNLNSADMFYKNLKALAEIKQFRDEINSLFRAIGYSDGVKDARFTRDKVWAEGLPFGAIGMLGDGRNRYIYSLLAVPGETTIKAWHVKALTGCDLYFMSRCGNAFYYANPPVVNQTMAYEEENPGKAKLKLKVIARYDGREYCVCNDCDNTSFVKGDVEKAVLAVQKVDDIPVTAGDDYPLKKVYIDVDKRTFKRICMYDVNGKYEKRDCNTNCNDNCGDDDCGEDDCDGRYCSK